MTFLRNCEIEIQKFDCFINSITCVLLPWGRGGEAWSREGRKVLGMEGKMCRDKKEGYI
jgi:hypothetical protein